MSLLHFNRRLTKGTYHAVRVFVGLVSTFVVLLIVALVFLRLYGVPGPLLREIIRRVNVAGIPVEVEGITLTLHGWRAEEVRYYSDNPDDLDPLFQFSQVFFSARSHARSDVDSEGWNVSVKAVGIRVNPSVEWGVVIPQDSPCHQVEQIKVSLRFLSDRIELSHGEMDWLGSRFYVNGTILKKIGESEWATAPRKQQTLSPTFITEQQFQNFESRLKMLTLPNGATIDIDFLIDTADYAASRMSLSVDAPDLSFRAIDFSRAEIRASYAYPTIQIERVGLFQDKQSIQVSGEYKLDSKVASGSLFNTITSNQLLLILPDGIHHQLSRSGLRIDHLPRLDLNVGPAPAKELLNQLSGTFSIRGVGYHGIEFEVLRGLVRRENGRLEFTKLQGTILGQEERADEMGSAMHGGSAEGSVFWNGNTREFGVDLDASLDPNILVQALSPVKIATNIIRRFRFKDRPPQGHVSLGANVDDWSTFYIDIQAVGNDVEFQGEPFNSINITETYRHGRLNLDPIAAMQGADFLKGSALLDFHESTVSFDMLSSMNPAALEDLIYAPINLFGNHINAGGAIRLAARGVFDWGSMRQTDFIATVEAETFQIPIAQFDHFSATLIGDGPLITVTNAVFSLYDGEGNGGLSLTWDPALNILPYNADLSFSKIDFQKFRAFSNSDRPINVSGEMEGKAHIEADFSTNFFASANGNGFVSIHDGQLADLPLFTGFSRLMRRIFPSFKIFSITRLKGNFTLENGVVLSEDALFEGNVISAKGRGSYTPSSGFDAYVQAQTLGEGKISSVVRVITNPLLKLFEMKLTGTLEDPVWNLEKF